MKKSPGRTFKLIFDVIILVFLSLMYRKNAVSMRFHELGGLVLGGLFILHKLLNLKWIRNVTAGIFHGKVKLNSLWIVDVLLLPAMAAVLLTGLFISKTLPTALRNGFRLQTWHYFAAALSLALTGIHLGLHWSLIRVAVWDKLPCGATVKKWLGIVLLCIVLGLGGYSLASTSTLSWFIRPFTVSMPAGGRNRAPGGAPRNAAASANSGPEDTAELPDDPGKSSRAPEASGSSGGPASDEVPGTGTPRQNRPGQGRGEGPSADRNRNGMRSRGAGPLKTVLSFSSVILLFAIVTGFLRAAFSKRRRVKT